MLAKERRETITQILYNHLTVSVKDLSVQMKVTMETIRNDLDYISSHDDKIIRIHGGAYKINRADCDPYFKDLGDNKAVEESRKLADVASSFVKKGDVIMLDSSTMSIFIAKSLIAKKIQATVITNSLPVSNLIAGSKLLSLFCLGGNLNIPTFSFKGTFTYDTLTRMHGDKAFLSPTGISMDFGLSQVDEFEARLAKSMIENSNEVYLVMPINKFDKATRTKISNLDIIDTIITENRLPVNWKNTLHENKVTIKYVD